MVGLYAAIPSLVLYAAAGSSRHLVVGPMSATAALSAASVAPFAGGDSALYVALTAALAIVTGILGLLAGLLRLGLHRVVHLRAGAEGFHRRAGADDPDRPGAEILRRPEIRG